MAKPVVYQQLSIQAGGKSLTFQTGKGGEFYLENVAPGAYSSSAVVDGGKQCAFEILIPETTETLVELPEIICRPRP